VGNEISNADADVGENSPPRGPVRVPRLTSIANTRREKVRQYGLHLRGEISNKTLHVRIFALKAIRDSFVADDLAQRMAALEERVEREKGQA
jgi:hypothetical protein